jgi:putative endonuclease
MEKRAYKEKVSPNITFAQQLGIRGEQEVARRYKQAGYAIIGRNICLYGYKQIGEIDIIALKEDELAFVEVKTRSKDFLRESVSRAKVCRLIKSAQLFVQNNSRYDKCYLRIDVALVNIHLDGTVKAVIILKNVVQDS